MLGAYFFTAVVHLVETLWHVHASFGVVGLSVSMITGRCVRLNRSRSASLNVPSLYFSQ